MVVAKNRVDVTQGMLGGLKFSYTCPHCKEKLVTNEDDVLRGDKCPTCSRKIMFDDGLVSLVKEKEEQQKEQQRQQLVRKEKMKQEKQERDAARQKENIRRHKLEEQNRLKHYEAEQRWKAEQKRLKSEKAQQYDKPTFGQSLAFVFGLLLLIFSWFIPFFGQMTLVAGGIFMICSCLSEISLQLVRLKHALQEKSSLTNSP